ncbi:MAG: AtpZ/AtpI family protein, partial [Pseudomonadota bacterium]
SQSDTSSARFDERLRQAQDRQREKTATARSADGTAMGIGMRLSAELVVATLIGGVLGYAFDWALGTSPWFLILMVLLGAAAGIRNMLRATDEISRAQAKAAAGEDDEG